MADDLGIGDLQPTNPDCKIKTPNLQQMAEQGITFLDAHSSSSVCTPTRYGVLTGRYNWRSRLAKGVLSGTSTHLIPAERATVAHLMRSAGYHTQMIGKWHLGWDWAKVDGKTGKGQKIDFTQPVKNGPDINGFDGYYGHCGSLDMPPYVWVDTGKITAVPQREEGVTSKEDAYGWYRKGPISPDFKIVDVLPHLFQKSLDHVRTRAAEAKNGQPFFLYLPLPAPHTPIVPVPPFKDASGMNPYADFVMQVDHHMGELMATLKESGIDDNTLVFFTSDNGCSPQGNFDVLKKHGHDPSAGYRGHKADIYEGGHRVPLIARWPSGIKPGQTTNALVCLTDLYATMREITGKTADDHGGEDSFSLNRPTKPDQPFHWWFIFDPRRRLEAVPVSRKRWLEFASRTRRQETGFASHPTLQLENRSQRERESGGVETRACRFTHDTAKQRSNSGSLHTWNPCYQ